MTAPSNWPDLVENKIRTIPLQTGHLAALTRLRDATRLLVQAIEDGGGGAGGGPDLTEVQNRLAVVEAILNPLTVPPPPSEGGVTALDWFLQRAVDGTVSWRPGFVMHQNAYGVFPNGYDPDADGLSGTLGDWLITEDGSLWVFKAGGGSSKWRNVGQLNLTGGGSSSFLGVVPNAAALTTLSPPADPDTWALVADGSAWQVDAGGTWQLRERFPVPVRLDEEWPAWGDAGFAGPSLLATHIDNNFPDPGFYELVFGDFRATAVLERIANTYWMSWRSGKGTSAMRLGPAGVGCELVLSDDKGRFHRYTAASVNDSGWIDAGSWDTKAKVSTAGDEISGVLTFTAPQSATDAPIVIDPPSPNVADDNLVMRVFTGAADPAELRFRGINGIGLGVRALAQNGAGGIAVGYEALALSTGGSVSSSAYGAQALSKQTTGTANTGIGRLAGRQVVTGSQNTAVGENAASLPSTVDANRFTALGVRTTITGDDAVAVGFGATAAANSVQLGANAQAFTAKVGNETFVSLETIKAALAGAADFDAFKTAVAALT